MSFSKFATSIAAAAVLTLLAPAAARADWQWTHWGMSADQAIGASGGKLTPVQGTDRQTVWGMDWRATGPLTVDGYAFTGDLYFDPATKGLAIVRLSLEDWDQCQRLIAATRNRYGAGADESTSFDVPAGKLNLPSWEWLDDGKGNAVLVSGVEPVGQMKGNCRLIYRRPGLARK